MFLFFSGNIPTSKNYVQIVDCSVALYGYLQKHALCQDPSKADSGPFCAQYHLQVPASGSESTSVPTLYPRSSLYFFLQNTMLEFPFAWWHKCVLLQSRTISASDESIHCGQWNEDSVSEEDMLHVGSLFDEPDVRGMLLRIKGGVTSSVLAQAVANLTQTLKYAMGNFSVTGFKSEREASAAQGISSMARVGAPFKYNMKCYKMAFFPSTPDAFGAVGQNEGIDQPTCSCGATTRTPTRRGTTSPA